MEWLQNEIWMQNNYREEQCIHTISRFQWNAYLELGRYINNRNDDDDLPALTTVTVASITNMTMVVICDLVANLFKLLRPPFMVTICNEEREMQMN
jgi:hypothetical protein